MHKVNWDDYRVAYQVALSGSLSKAAKELQCNHATVLRHINRLESAISIKLFIRHQRGYRLTDAGTILINEMPYLYSEFRRLENLLGSVEQDISGNLRITTLLEFSYILNPALLQIRKKFPDLRIQLISTDEVIPVSGGEAHVSLRAGSQPDEPDLIVRELVTINMQYYAADSYIQQYGIPESSEDYNHHNWVMPSADKQHLSYVKSILEVIDHERIVFQSNHFIDLQSAVVMGMGIGLISEAHASQFDHLHKLSLKEIEGHSKGTLWYVYHRDLKNNAKVQALYKQLKMAL